VESFDIVNDVCCIILRWKLKVRFVCLRPRASMITTDEVHDEIFGYIYTSRHKPNTYILTKAFLGLLVIIVTKKWIIIILYCWNFCSILHELWSKRIKRTKNGISVAIWYFVKGNWIYLLMHIVFLHFLDWYSCAATVCVCHYNEHPLLKVYW